MCIKPHQHPQHLLECSNLVETVNFEVLTGYGVFFQKPWILVAEGKITHDVSSFITGS